MNQVSWNSERMEARRKVLKILGLLSVFSMVKVPLFRRLPRNIISCGPPGRTEPQKLLGQDGRLVEVDMSKIRVIEKKISDEGLKGWVKRHL